MASQIKIAMCEIIDSNVSNRIAHDEEIRLRNNDGCRVHFERVFSFIVNKYFLYISTSLSLEINLP